MKHILLPLLLGAVAASAAPLEAVRGRVQPIEPHFIGFNQNFMGQTDPWNDRLIAQLKASEAATFRYPAGTVGSYWNWHTGRVDETLDPADVMSWVQPHVRGGARAGQGRYTLENLKKAVDATGIVPVFMIGMAVHDIDEQIAILKDAEKSGIPIRYLELGNELIFKDAEPLLEKKFPDAQTYGRIASDWIARLRAAFPAAKIAACGTFVASDSQSERRRLWNPRMMETLKGTDIITTHLYAGEIVRTEEERAGLTEVAAQQALTAGERAARRRGPITAESTAATFGLVYTVWDRMLEKSLIPPGKQLWVTEWNTGGAGGGGNQWQTTLATAALLDAFLRTNVTLTNHHTMGSAFANPGGGGGGGNAAAAPGTNPAPRPAPVNPGNSANFSTGPNATGLALREFARITTGFTRAVELRFPDAPVAKVKSGREYPTIVGWAFGPEQGAERTALLLNLGDTPVTVARATLPAAMKHSRQLAAAPDADPAKIQPVSGILADTLALPPYSLTVLHE